MYPKTASLPLERNQPEPVPKPAHRTSAGHFYRKQVTVTQG